MNLLSKVLLNPFLHFLNIFCFSFGNACFFIVVQLQDIGSSHLEVFSNLGVPPISDKSYSLRILENTLANGYYNIKQIPPFSKLVCFQTATLRNWPQHECFLMISHVSFFNAFLIVRHSLIVIFSPLA